MKVTLRVTAGPNDGEAFTFDMRDRFIVGRSPRAQLCVSRDRYFSRHHFMVEVDPPNVYLLDLGSTNGTYVGSKDNRVRETDLSDGDIILGGDTELAVSVEGAPRVVDPMASAYSLGAMGSGVAPSPAIVRCGQCGQEADSERPRSSEESVTFICRSCQDDMRQTPVLPKGYRAIRTLGRGAMGSVVLAEHEETGQQRAIKLVMPNAALSADGRERFLKQAREQAELEHANIVRVFDIHEGDGGLFFVVMEYVDSVGLNALLRDRGTLDAATIARIGDWSLEALAYAHERKFVHRDLKPSNILVASDVTSIKLADFGLARSYEESGASGFHRGADDSSSLRYMAPEQIIDFRNVGPLADIYALSTTLYVAACGHHPLKFDGIRDPFIVILEDEPEPLANRAPGVSIALAAVIDRGLLKDPSKRHPSASAMRAALAAAV